MKLKSIMIRRMVRSADHPAGELIETAGHRLNRHFGLVEIDRWKDRPVWGVIHLGSGLSAYRTCDRRLACFVASKLVTRKIDWKFTVPPKNIRDSGVIITPIVTQYYARRRKAYMSKLAVSASFCAVLLCPSVASAQAITAWTLRIFNAGATTALSTTDLLAANVICNQAPPPAGSAVNPSRVAFDDVGNAGRVCIWTDPGTGPLFSVPFGGAFEASLTATNVAGTSAESARASFTRPGLAPGAPMGVRLVGP